MFSWAQRGKEQPEQWDVQMEIPHRGRKATGLLKPSTADAWHCPRTGHRVSVIGLGDCCSRLFSTNVRSRKQQKTPDPRLVPGACGRPLLRGYHCPQDGTLGRAMEGRLGAMHDSNDQHQLLGGKTQ